MSTSKEQSENILEYFDSTSSGWNILDYLNKYDTDTQSFDQGIGLYLRSLEIIANNGEGKRRERAQILLDRYKKGDRPDYKQAREWEKNHAMSTKVGETSIHIHNPTFAEIGAFNGDSETINIGGTINTTLPGKRKSMDNNESRAKSNKGSKKPKRRPADNNIVETTDNHNNEEQKVNNDFDLAYHGLNKTKMWTLESSGRIVEEVIYEYARTLGYESCLHSFIINDVDKKTKSLFQEKEWEEIFSSNLKDIQKIDKPIINLMKKYSVRKIVRRLEEKEMEYLD